MPLTPPPDAALAEVDPTLGLVDATDSELWMCWGGLDWRIRASLTPDWIPCSSGTHYGYDLLARSRLFVIGVGVSDIGLAEIIVDFQPRLEANLRSRIATNAGATVALIFERLKRFTPLRVISAACLPNESLEHA